MFNSLPSEWHRNNVGNYGKEPDCSVYILQRWIVVIQVPSDNWKKKHYYGDEQKVKNQWSCS